MYAYYNIILFLCSKFSLVPIPEESASPVHERTFSGRKGLLSSPSVDGVPLLFERSFSAVDTGFFENCCFVRMKEMT